MHVMITIDHPWSQSFNHTVLELVVKTLTSGGHTVDVLDLHHEDFDPVMRVEELSVYSQGTPLDPKVIEYQRRISQADHLVYIFPVWWEVMPALLKGFFDKVFLPQWAFAEADASPLLTHIRSGTAITTMGAPKPIYTSVEPVLCKGILEFCGVQRTRWFNICQVNLIAPEERAAWLNEIEAYFRSLA
ncbi:MAG: NAD(P)H-dependent oxidoreductase [Chloroflexi bacterium]|nr:NAD(P)H-dependent oxidoreductase [Chloroflexota bacterium]